MSATDATEWIRYAVDDARAARILLAHGASAHLAAGHAQQCAEKAIKAVIVARGQTPKKTHDLSVLLQHLGTALPGMPPDLDVDGLTEYTVGSRYPDDLPQVSQDQAEGAIETAEAVLAAVRAALGA